MHIYDQFGIRREMSDIRAVDHLFKLKQENGSNPWPVIEECFKIWEAKNPGSWKAFLVNVEETRSTRSNDFASSDPKKDTVHNGILRYTLDLPEHVVYMIRCVYNPNELDMNRDFFIAFAKRYPGFKVAKKI